MHCKDTSLGCKKMTVKESYKLLQRCFDGEIR